MSYDSVTVGTSSMGDDDDKITIEKVDVGFEGGSKTVVLPLAFERAMDDAGGQAALGPLCGWGDDELEPTSSTVKRPSDN